MELAKPTQEAGRAALAALEMSLKEYREGLFDVLVTAPINKTHDTVGEFSFSRSY